MDGEEEDGLLERPANTGRHTVSRSNRRACGPGKALEFSCLVTAPVRSPVSSVNSFALALV